MNFKYINPSSPNSLKRGDTHYSYYCPPIMDLDYNMPVCFAKLGIRRPPTTIRRDSLYPCLEINVAAEGNIVLELLGKEYKISAGQGFIIQPYTPHVFYPVDNEPWTIYFLSFEGRLKSEICRYTNTDFTVMNLEAFLARFYDFATLPLSDDWSYKNTDMAYSFLVRLNQIFAFPSDPQYSGMLKLNAAVNYIRSHLDEPYDAEKLADVIGVSSSYMRRLFKKVYNVAPTDFVKSLKISTAQNMLSSDQAIKIKDVAIKVGYPDANYFGAIFKKIVGCTPKQWQFGNPNIKK